MNLTLPEKLLQDIQHEADVSKRTISEVIVSTVEQSWQSPDQERGEVKHLVTQLAEHVETELATINQVLSRVVTLLEDRQPQQQVEPSEVEPHVMTTEEMEAMYRETEAAAAAAEALKASQQAAKSPELRRSWWHRLIFSS